LSDSLGADDSWRGITVDARAELLDRLPNRANVEKINALITASDVDGEADFFYVPQELVVQRGFPQWLDGCGSTRRDHAILRLFSDEAVVQKRVPTRSVASIFDRVGTQTPDVVKVDLEGGDFDVVNAMLNEGVRPMSLEFEVVHMSGAQRAVLGGRLAGFGYTFVAQHGDSVTYVCGEEPTPPVVQKPQETQETQTPQKSLLIYSDTIWALGAIHNGLMAALRQLGWRCEARQYTSDWDGLVGFAEEARGFDHVLAIPGGNAEAMERYGVPREKTTLVAHAEQDLQYARNVDGYAGFGVVSDSLAHSSVAWGLGRTPQVVRVGVDCDQFRMPPATMLTTVGYASVLSKRTDQGIEIKRGALAQQCAAEAELQFHPAFDPDWADHRKSILPLDQMPAFYKTVDCVLVPSLMEGASLPALEGAASGRLVIGTPVGHIPRLAYEGLLLLAPLGADAFRTFAVERLRHFKGNPQSFADHCRIAQSAAQARDWKHVVGDWISLLTGV
jgi:Methyltransferase FkbM domain